MSERSPRTKTGNWLVSTEGLDPDALSYHDVTGDRIDLRETVCRIEDEAQSMRWARKPAAALQALAQRLTETTKAET